ncbi:MAG: DNA internalization-related competence protein ComEC/Rec2 [Firmicutes bacterium]|nr:DNA internalization-related competence protein ComEC/Rec2 [Bacillota bacterium]
MPALIAITLAFATGILIYDRLPFHLWLTFAITATAIAIWAIGRRKHKAATVSILLLAVLAGALRMAAANIHVDELAPYADQFVLVEGVVVGEAEPTAAGASYVLAVQKLGPDRLHPAVGRVQLRDLRAEGDTYKYGDVVQVKGRLTRPRAAANFGQFNVQAYLERRGIFYQIVASAPNSIQRVGENRGSPLLEPLFGLRRRFMQTATLLPSSEAALLKALVLGQRQSVDPETMNFFTASGIVHLMAVSGVHVGLVAALALKLARLLRLPFSGQGILTVLIILIYTALAGFTPSAVRAGIMFLLGLLGLSTGRPRNSLVALAAAALTLLLVNPSNLFEVGFQLSFAAAGGILYFGFWLIELIAGRYRLGIPIAVSAAAQLFTWPLTAYYFSGVSLIGFVASVVAIPLAGLALSLSLFGLAAGSLYAAAGKLILGAAGAVLVALTSLARLFASIPGAFVYVRKPPLLFIAVYYLLILAAPLVFRLDYGRVWLRRSLFVTVAAVLLFVTWLSPVTSSLVVDFLAVGQGDAILIRTPSGQAALIDTGPRVSTGRGIWDAGESIVLPYLRSEGVHRLELMFLTHGDLDHTGGAPAILSSMPVGAVIAPASFEGPGAELVRRELEQRGIPLYTGSTGTKVDLGAGVEATILSPPSDPIISAEAQNDNSLVVYLRHGQCGFLFTGDAGQPAEQYLLQREFPGPVNVLKVAHHGAATATSEEFVERLKPELAVISVGKNNFGHPSPSTLERLLASGALVLRTDEDGQVRVESNGQQIVITTQARNRGD